MLDVYVDGRQVGAEGNVLTLNQADAGESLVEAQHRMMAAVPQREYRKRTAEEIPPLSLELR